MIPLVDLRAQHLALGGEIQRAIAEVLDSLCFIQGPKVRAFEAAMAAAHGAKHAVGCSNGTSAISLALEALGVGPGDEVITTTNTFVATAEAVVHAGARPVFVDIDPETWQMSPSSVRRAITARTRALLPVHLYGNPCAMDAFTELAREHHLLLIEDCAQAHLATFGGKAVGTFGDAATFSFYPGKNLGAIGDAGMVFAAEAPVAERIRKLLDHGRLSKYEHDLVGYNRRMDEIQAAVLLVKLRHLQKWTATRRMLAARYGEALAARGFNTMRETAGALAVYHLYCVEVSNREDTAAAMRAAGVSTGVHYPLPLHLQPAFRQFGYHAGSFPVAESHAARTLSLPLCAELSTEAQDRVLEAFLKIAQP